MKVFSAKGESYLKDEMCICLDGLNNEILSEAKESVLFFHKLIDFLIDLEFPYPFENIQISNANEENIKFLNLKLDEFLEDNKLKEDSSDSRIFDEIYHAFRTFKLNGLLGLYLARSGEVWYPKIIIDKNLGSRDDIENLEEEIIVYRGTSLDEFNSGKFSQSWTLSEEVASDFAFKHYRQQPSFVNTMRVVVEANLNKKDIYFYNKALDEQEVIINSSKLIVGSIKIIKKKLLSN